MKSNYQEFLNRENRIRMWLATEGYMQECRHKYYDLAIVSTEVVDYPYIFGKSKNQIFFEANKRLDYIGKCDHFFILKKNSNIEFVWTSFLKKQPAILQNKNIDATLDFMFLQFVKKNQNVLSIGFSRPTCIAAYKNNCNIDAYEFNREEYNSAVEGFKNEFHNQQLPF